MNQDRERLHTAVLVAPSKERRKLRKQRRRAEARLHAEQRKTELAAAKVEVRQRLGADIIDIATASGTVVARHQVAEPGLGVTIRDSGHVTALEAIAMASATPGRPHRRKERIPPGSAALRAAAALRRRAACPHTCNSCIPCRTNPQDEAEGSGVLWVAASQQRGA